MEPPLKLGVAERGVSSSQLLSKSLSPWKDQATKHFSPPAMLCVTEAKFQACAKSQGLSSSAQLPLQDLSVAGQEWLALVALPNSSSLMG